MVWEKRKATDTLRQYVYGPGNMQPDDALQRYKERRVRDAQAPVGSTDFDDLAASDSDAEESDDDILGAGATTSKPALPEALSRTDSDRELASLCDVEPAGCAFAWLLLLLSAAAHAICYCKGGECESDDEDEPSTMYS